MTLDQLRLALRDHRSSTVAQRRFDITPLDGSPSQPAAAPLGVDPRVAAVLALIYPTADELVLALTVRSTALPDHAGQISLPGGTRDPDDASLIDTALRETTEELGMSTSKLEILAELAPVYVPPSNYLITPFVATTATRPLMQPNPAEVAELVELPLAVLMRPEAVESERWTLRGCAYQVPFYRFGEHKIWGATARVLSMLSHAITPQ